MEDRCLLSAASFSPPVSYGTGTGPFSVVVGDFNGDGKPDLVVANKFANTVSVLLGNGDGSFQTQRVFAVGSGPFSVAVGDFNRDGKLDLAVANLDRSVNVLLGKGDGTFQTARNFAVPAEATSVVVGDFNGDGRLDLAVANSDVPTNTTNVSVLLGNGDGTFQAARNFAVGSYPVSMAVGDFNGDRRLDLAVTINSPDHKVSVLLGNGDGTFQTAQNFAVGSYPVSVAVGDFNGDGRLDLAVANEADNNVSVLLGKGDGTFQTAQNFPAGSGPTTLAVGDFNGDGKLDLAVGQAVGNNITVLLGNGDGTFPTAQNFLVPPGGFNYNTVAVGDFNADGKPDLAVANIYGNNLSVLLNQFATTTAVSGPTNSTYGQSVTYTANVTSAGVPVIAGSVTFEDGSTPISTALPLDASGQATFSIATASVGSHTITASYSGTLGGTGTTGFGASAATLTLKVHDPVVEASSPTFARDLQAAVTLVDGPTFVGTPRVEVHVHDGAPMPVFAAALARLTVNPAGLAIEVILDVDPGSYNLGKISVPPGLRLVVNGSGSGQVFAGSSTPALTLVAGDVRITGGLRFTGTGDVPAILVQGGHLLFDGGGQIITGSSGPALKLVAGVVDIRDGAVFDTTGHSPTIHVQGGQLDVLGGTVRKTAGNAATVLVKGGTVTVRGSTIEESSDGNQSAFDINGGLVDLGTGNDPGLNTINVHGPGDLIRNTGTNNVLAVGNLFLQDGVAFANDYRIEDAIDHSMDGLEGGTVFWVPDNVFVSANHGRVQRGVDSVPVGGTVNVETGVHGAFSVGTKLLTVAFQDGSSMVQQVDSLDPTRRTLVVTGTYANDTLEFEPGDDRGVRVAMNNLPRGTFLPNGRLIAIGVDGSDNIAVSDDIHLSAWLFGGASGNNRLQGGGGNDVLIGGFGNDTLIGGGGRDLLIGDGGTDHLDGRSGEDILIGGVTAFDDAAFNPYSEAVLAAIMAEWTSSRDYATRVNNLFNGGGLNGSYTLTPGGTVFDDGAANVLDGGAGQDLFFASLTDTVLHRRSNETLFNV